MDFSCLHLVGFREFSETVSKQTNKNITLMAKENNAQKPNQKKTAAKSLLEKRADKKAKEKGKSKYD